MGTWYIRSFYRAAAKKEGEKKQVRFTGSARRSDGMQVALKQQVIIHFFMEIGVRIMN
jgi:hypothetical protein